jgi:hypothetical protein
LDVDLGPGILNLVFAADQSVAHGGPSDDYGDRNHK